MANIFAQQNTVNNTPKRNNFDLSYQNHMTMKFGTLYPFMCKEVVPGDTFRIESALGLQFMPLAFPVQSRMRAHMHFFYVRNKNLWKNWQNWISNLADRSAHPHPYVLPDAEEASQGSIFDFLNLPTTITSENFPVAQFPLGFYNNSDYMALTYSAFITTGDDPVVGTNLDIGDGTNFPTDFFVLPLKYDVVDGSVFKVPDVFTTAAWPTPPVDGGFICVVSSDVALPTSLIEWGEIGVSSIHTRVERFSSALMSSDGGGFVKFVPSSPFSYSVSDGRYHYLLCGFRNSSSYHGFAGYPFPRRAIVNQNVGTISLNTAANLSGSNTLLDPFEDLMPSALPLRAYESIYNAFYRNTVNQPFIKNGEPVYNEYITNDGDGYDSTQYHLFQRNYEMDFLTSCLPSPQQGKAPLVGMSALGEISIEDDHGLTTAKAKLADDGNTIVGVEVTSPIADIDHARLLMNMAASGMSINDFRQTNALQHWLETNIRKGYKYVDFIAGHFGKSPEYRELDMPEFIGGFSRDVNVSTIISQADTYGISNTDGGAELGSYVGHASLFAGGDHAVTHYCDDYGFIMGIVCVVPDPAYSQLMPKMFLKRNPLDYYFPEFAQVGMQPVTYEEVAPLQTIVDRLTDESKKLTDTFGYQRPYYDLISSVNEVHGDFRGNLRDFLINRRFDTRPELGNKFLIIDPDEVNDIFINQNPDDDSIIGQIVLKIQAKRPIPRVHIPSLGK